MKNSFEHIEKIMKPFREMQERLKPMIETQKRMEDLSRVQKSFENMSKVFASTIPKFNNAFLERLESFKEIGNRLKEYEEKTPDYLLLIAQNGWYLEFDCEMKLPSEIAKDFEADKSDVTNKKMTEYYTENLNRIFIENFSISFYNK